MADLTRNTTLPDSANKADFHNLVDTATITDDKITTAMLQNLAVTTGKLNADAVDGTKLADDAVDTEHIADDAVDSDQIAAGAVDNAHLAGSIADSKLSQITTAAKVSGAALTALASIPAGAGDIPTANLGNVSNHSITVGNTTQDISSETTTTVSGLTGTPVLVLVLANVNNTEKSSIGWSDGTTHAVLHDYDAESADKWGSSTARSIFLVHSASNYMAGVIGVSSGQFTITWTKTGSPTGTANIMYVVFSI